MINIQKSYEKIRQGIKSTSFISEQYFDLFLGNLDNFIESDKASDLEKAFYILLNQSPTQSRPYLIVPNERVLVKTVFWASPDDPPFFEYEIDFAVYGGTIENPVKIAIECDGIRSHRERHSAKERRKNINLQTAGWLILRYGSHEIHEEIQKLEKNGLYQSKIVYELEGIIEESTKLVTYVNYNHFDIRKKLTGYDIGRSSCPECNNVNIIILNHKKVVCTSCKKEYTRDRSKDPDSV